MGGLNTPVFILAVFALVLATGIEAGTSLMTPPSPDPGRMKTEVKQREGLDGSDLEKRVNELVDPKQEKPPPGLGIPSLAILDALAVVTALLMGLALLLPGRVQGRIQGVINLVAGVLVALGSIALIFFALTLALTMFGLFVATPFGTLAYLGIWGFFDRDAAATLLSLAMFLKIVFGVLLVIANPRFLENTGLILLIITTLVATFVVGFLHGIVPGILVSITDAVAAIVVGILALIWGVVFALGSVIPIINALRIAPAKT